MSERKTYLSGPFARAFDFELLDPEVRHSIERELTFTTGERLAWIRDAIGSDRFVQVAGRSTKQVGRYLKGDAAPAPVLQAISLESGQSMDWIATGALRTAADVRAEIAMLRIAAREPLFDLRIARPEPRWSTQGYKLKIIDDRLGDLQSLDLSELPAMATGELASDVGQHRDTSVDAEFVRLPIYRDVSASAGPGAVPASEQADSVISFERRFLRDQGAAPESCSVIWARGDSMMPTIPDGSILVVDSSQRAISNGCIMVIGVGDDLLVKRVRRRLDGLIDLISDNTAYAPETLGPDALAQLRVIGRVVYFCRTP